jgi:hypothetical protein
MTLLKFISIEEIRRSKLCFSDGAISPSFYLISLIGRIFEGFGFSWPLSKGYYSLEFGRAP